MADVTIRGIVRALTTVPLSAHLEGEDDTGSFKALLSDVLGADDIFKCLAADDTGANSASVQPWFPTAGAVALESDSAYFFEGYLWLQRSTGTTSHTTSIGFGGTAALASIQWYNIYNIAASYVGAAAQIYPMAVTTMTVLTGASASATENGYFMVFGSVRVTTAGTLIPQFQYSAAPGGAPTVKAGTFFRLRKIGAAAVTTRGTWS